MQYLATLANYFTRWFRVARTLKHR